jgi:hypothetical protein
VTQDRPSHSRIRETASFLQVRMGCRESGTYGVRRCSVDAKCQCNHQQVVDRDDNLWVAGDDEGLARIRNASIVPEPQYLKEFSKTGGDWG